MASPSVRSARPARWLARLVAGAGIGALTAGCGLGSSAGGQTTSSDTSRSASSSSTSPAPASTSATTPPRTAPANCAEVLTARLTAAQRVGQLLMAGLDTAAPRTSLDDEIAGYHVGGVIYLGGWTGGAKVSGTSSHLQSRVTRASTGEVGLLIAADQEGGEVQQLKGSGFSDIPSALAQGRLSPTTLRAHAKVWATELARAGVNINLAPVADTVPLAIGKANSPIGLYSREYANEPAAVGRSVTAVTQGMEAGGVQATVKHFPGLGRITNNTDVSSTGITDATTTANDAYLRPFAAGIRSGAGLVMVSSAFYPKIDPANQAVFSPAVISTLLRGRMAYGGVVITDDVGHAKAVAAFSPGSRALKFIGAGGDIVLTADPADVAPMTAAITQRMQSDPSFARKVNASVTRVLALKVRMGLARC